jgi:hypothetical protein
MLPLGATCTRQLTLNGTSGTEAFRNQTGQQSWSGPIPDLVPVV